jgi:hypothetical protein
VEGARAHRGGVPSGGPIEIERPGEPAAVENVEVRPEGDGEALVLLGVDGEQAKGLDELAEMTGRRRDEQGDAAGLQHARNLGGVTRSEDIEDRGRDTVPKRKGPPDIGSHGNGPGMSPRSPAQRGLRDIECDPKRARKAVEHTREIPTRARAQIDNERRARRRRDSLGDRVRDRFGQRLEVPRLQEPLAGSHHVGGVAGVGASGTGKQAQVALAGDVERVARVAAHRVAVASPEAGAAVRTAQ